MWRRPAALFVLLLCATFAHAATFVPAAPTDRDVIVANFLIQGGCTTTISTVVAGTTVRTTFSLSNCPVLPVFLVPVHATFGPLPAGTYTYELYEILEGDPATLVSQQTLIVAATPAPVPALADGAGVLLLLGLVVVGMALLGRQG